MEWFRQHADTISIITTFIICFWTLNTKINDIEKDLTVIKTVLVMKHILPSELATNE